MAQLELRFDIIDTNRHTEKLLNVIEPMIPVGLRNSAALETSPQERERAQNINILGEEYNAMLPRPLELFAPCSPPRIPPRAKPSVATSGARVSPVSRDPPPAPPTYSIDRHEHWDARAMLEPNVEQYLPAPHLPAPADNRKDSRTAYKAETAGRFSQTFIVAQDFTGTANITPMNLMENIHLPESPNDRHVSDPIGNGQHISLNSTYIASAQVDERVKQTENAPPSDHLQPPPESQSTHAQLPSAPPYVYATSATPYPPSPPPSYACMAGYQAQTNYLYPYPTQTPIPTIPPGFKINLPSQNYPQNSYNPQIPELPQNSNPTHIHQPKNYPPTAQSANLPSQNYPRNPGNPKIPELPQNPNPAHKNRPQNYPEPQNPNLPAQNNPQNLFNPYNPELQQNSNLASTNKSQPLRFPAPYEKAPDIQSNLNCSSTNPFNSDGQQERSRVINNIVKNCMEIMEWLQISGIVVNYRKKYWCFKNDPEVKWNLGEKEGLRLAQKSDGSKRGNNKRKKSKAKSETPRRITPTTREKYPTPAGKDPSQTPIRLPRKCPDLNPVQPDWKNFRQRKNRKNRTVISTAPSRSLGEPIERQIRRQYTPRKKENLNKVVRRENYPKDLKIPKLMDLIIPRPFCLGPVSYKHGNYSKSPKTQTLRPIQAPLPLMPSSFTPRALPPNPAQIISPHTLSHMTIQPRRHWNRIPWFNETRYPLGTRKEIGTPQRSPNPQRPPIQPPVNPTPEDSPDLEESPIPIEPKLYA